MLQTRFFLDSFAHPYFDDKTIKVYFWHIFFHISILTKLELFLSGIKIFNLTLYNKIFIKFEWDQYIYIYITITLKIYEIYPTLYIKFFFSGSIGPTPTYITLSLPQIFMCLSTYFLEVFNNRKWYIYILRVFMLIILIVSYVVLVTFFLKIYVINEVLL